MYLIYFKGTNKTIMCGIYIIINVNILKQLNVNLSTPFTHGDNIVMIDIDWALPNDNYFIIIISTYENIFGFKNIFKK